MFDRFISIITLAIDKRVLFYAEFVGEIFLREFCVRTMTVRPIAKISFENTTSTIMFRIRFVFFLLSNSYPLAILM